MQTYVLVRCLPRTTDALWSLFQWYPKPLGLCRQIGLINVGTFAVFPAELLFSTIFSLRVPFPWENGFGCFSYKQFWFSCIFQISNYCFYRAWISVGVCESFTENLFTLAWKTMKLSGQILVLFLDKNRTK